MFSLCSSVRGPRPSERGGQAVQVKRAELECNCRHRTIEWFGQKDLKAHLTAPAMVGHLPPAQAAEGPPSPASSTSRHGAPTAALGRLWQGLTTLLVRNFFLLLGLRLLFQFKALTHCAVTLPVSPFLQLLKAAVRSSRAFSRLNSPAPSAHLHRRGASAP